jgi:uncharacterized protein
MENDVAEASIRGLLPLDPHPGASLFLGTDEKVFDIAVDLMMFQALRRALAGEKSPRPLSHELIGRILTGFDITLERVVINDINEATYFARLILSMRNELGTKLVEIDARPSDCIVLAIQHGRPIFVARSVLERVEDKLPVLRALEEQGQIEHPDGPFTTEDPEPYGEAGEDPEDT